MPTPSDLSYREIPSSRGPFLIDSDDYERVIQYKWRPTTHKHSGPYLRSTTRGSHATRKQLLLHRFVLGLNPGDANIVDHINGNTFDNRKANLRVVNGYQNMWNMRISSSNRTGMKSVHWDKREGKWIVAVYKENKKFGGQCRYFVDAAQACVFIRYLIHGDYACFE